MKLTPAVIEALSLPAGVHDRTYFDDSLPGFGVRLRDTGQRRWICQYDIGGKTRRMTLGSTTLLNLSAARDTARDILAAVRLGKDPAAEKQQTRQQVQETFGSKLPQYLRQVNRRPRSFSELERHLCKHAKPLHSQPLATLDRRTIGALITRLAEHNGLTVAKSTRADIIKYLTWAMREGLLDGTNPATLTNMPAVADPRTRLLSLTELREILTAAPDNDYGCIVKLLAYLACRRSEIGDLQWTEVQFDMAELRLPPARCKNGRTMAKKGITEHVIPLPPAALALLKARARKGDRPYVFGRGNNGAGYQGWAQDKAALDDRIAANRIAAGITEPMAPWVIHDFRRAFSTHCHDTLGQQPHVIEACLGHFQGGIAATYNRASYLRERRDVLERWAAFIEGQSAVRMLNLA
jgi:integrase